MAKVLTTSIAAVTLLAGASAPSSANPLGFAGSFLHADQLIEQRATENVMNSSLWSADLTTHAKIVAVSLIAAIFVVTVGISARMSDADTAGIRTNVDAPVVVKAGKPLVFTTNDTSTTR
ncbi:MAG: hypothetical protein WAJ88_03705 [Pseudolabrys sp.]